MQLFIFWIIVTKSKRALQIIQYYRRVRRKISSIDWWEETSRALFYLFIDY
jgi:hypothetical protein